MSRVSRRSLLLLRRSAGFNFAAISTCKMWADARTLGGGDGAAVATWANRAVAANPLVQATGTNQPMFKTSIFGTKPAVLFDGTDNFLTSPSTPCETGDTWFVVMQNTRGVGAINDYVMDGTDTNTHVLFQYDDDTKFSMYAGGGPITSSAVASQSLGLLTAKFNGASSTLRYNATQVASGDISSSTSAGLTIGAAGGGAATQPWKGYIALVLGYSTISDANRDIVEAAINREWGIY